MGKNITHKHLLLFFLLVCYQSSIAQKIYYVGIPSAKLNYVASTQKKPQWCWAASIQMVLNYYNVSISQQQIVERTYGRNMHGELPDWAAGIETIHKNLNNWSVDNDGKNYIVTAQFGLGAPPPFFLIEELRQQRPVIIGYQSNFGGHAAVVTALSYYETNLGPVVRTIILRDPLPDAQAQMNKGRVEFDAQTLAERITAYWFVRVFDTGF